MRKTTVLAFVVGAAVGAASAWYYAKKKYEQIAQEEIDSVKAKFNEMRQEIKPEDSESLKYKKEVGEPLAQGLQEGLNSAKLAAQAKEKPGIMEYAARLSELGYTDYTDAAKNGYEDDNEDEDEEPEVTVRESRTANSDRPYVIRPEEFDELPDYDPIMLTWYSDKILAEDSNDDIVEDIEGTVGFDSIARMGEYEPEIIHVRNDRLKCDFEITVDYRRFEDVIAKKPYKAGV